MNNPQSIAATFIRETLITFTSVQALVGLEDVVGQYKIFWESVPDWATMPYIVSYHIMGGDENRTQTDGIDIQMKVVGFTGNLVTANSLANAINGLHRCTPVSPSYAEDNDNGYEWVLPYGKIQLKYPIFDRDVAQNVPVHIVGGIYRLRLMRQIDGS